MPLYHFKLVDTVVVVDYGVHELRDETAAQIEALKLAQSVRQARPELLGKNYSIRVTREDGVGLCLIPIDAI